MAIVFHSPQPCCSVERSWGFNHIKIRMKCRYLTDIIPLLVNSNYFWFKMPFAVLGVRTLAAWFFRPLKKGSLGGFSN